jgi:AbrB family looped-hinge helix DNA binding protein
MVTVSKNYKITITREVREDLNIQAGDKVVFIKNNKDKWEIRPLNDLMDDMLDPSGD